MDKYNCNHFTLSLPNGEDQNISSLLVHLANKLQELNITELRDISYHEDTDENGNPFQTLTVYY